jgi:hypothetical protein
LELRCFLGPLSRSCWSASPSSDVFLSPPFPDLKVLYSRRSSNYVDSRAT